MADTPPKSRSVGPKSDVDKANFAKSLAADLSDQAAARAAQIKAMIDPSHTLLEELQRQKELEHSAIASIKDDYANSARRLADELSGHAAAQTARLNELINPKHTLLEDLQRQWELDQSAIVAMKADYASITKAITKDLLDQFNLATTFRADYDFIRDQLSFNTVAAKDLLEGFKLAALGTAAKDWPLAGARGSWTTRLLDDQANNHAEIRRLMEGPGAAFDIAGALANWKSAYADASDSAASRRNPDDFSAALARVAGELADKLAEPSPPQSASEVARSIAAVDVRELGAAIGEALRDNAKDQTSAAQKAARLALWLPLIIAIVQIILAPAFQRWLDMHYPPAPNPTPPPTSTPASTSGLYVVTSTEAVLRVGPSTQQRHAARIERGQVVHLVKTKGQWAFVLAGDQAGWIKTKYLRTLESVAASIMSVQLLAESQAPETSRHRQATSQVGE